MNVIALYRVERRESHGITWNPRAPSQPSAPPQADQQLKQRLIASTGDAEWAAWFMAGGDDDGASA